MALFASGCAVLIETHNSQYRQLVKYYAGQIDKMAIAELPRYEEHGRDVVLVDDKNSHQAIADLLKQRYLGFDTESKPVFQKGATGSGISIVQISSLDRCYIFLLNSIADSAVLGEFVNNQNIIKVGVGLKDDLSKLRGQCKLHPVAFVDLGTIFKTFGRKNSIGSKQLVALVLQKQLRKSKSVTTSNWAAATLSPMQIAYASDDAFSSIDAYLRLREVFVPYVEQLDRGVLRLLDL